MTPPVTDVLFPAMSQDNPDATGVLATWYARDGEQVTEGQLVAEVPRMDKVDADVVAPATGTLRLAVAEARRSTREA
ncbi:MAG: lipoyl domain-containing protein [Nocardioides sp.]